MLVCTCRNVVFPIKGTPFSLRSHDDFKPWGIDRVVLYFESTSGCFWRHKVETDCGWLKNNVLGFATQLVVISMTTKSATNLKSILGIVSSHENIILGKKTLKAILTHCQKIIDKVRPFLGCDAFVFKLQSNTVVNVAFGPKLSLKSTWCRRGRFVKPVSIKRSDVSRFSNTAAIHKTSFSFSRVLLGLTLQVASLRWRTVTHDVEN